MDTKRILVVEDHHETNRMIRTALESLGQKLTIVTVPSGEEASIEVRLGQFDLVITDVMLPGISGIEFIERMRKTTGDAKIIVMTGNPSSALNQKIEELSVHAYFTKPLDMMAMLNTVRVALGMEGPKEPPPAPTAPDTVNDDILSYVSQGIRTSRSTSDRLSQLRRDLSALAVYLLDQDGYITTRAGDISSLDVEEIVTDIEVAFNAGLRVSQELGFGASRNLQFFDGSDYGMYVVNVGQFFMLVIIYDSERSAKQIGQVMLYGRRGADDLLNMMAEISSEAPLTEISDEAVPAPTVEIEIPEEAKEVLGEALGTGPLGTGSLGTGPLKPPPGMEPEAEPEPDEEVIELDLDVLLGGSTDVKDADSFWDDATAEEETEESSTNALSFEQAMKLGLFSDEEE